MKSFIGKALCIVLVCLSCVPSLGGQAQAAGQINDPAYAGYEIMQLNNQGEYGINRTANPGDGHPHNFWAPDKYYGGAPKAKLTKIDMDDYNLGLPRIGYELTATNPKWISQTGSDRKVDIYVYVSNMPVSRTNLQNPSFRYYLTSIDGDHFFTQSDNTYYGLLFAAPVFFPGKNYHTCFLRIDLGGGNFGYHFCGGLADDPIPGTYRVVENSRDYAPVYRYWSAEKNSHFYTADHEEARKVFYEDPSWRIESVAFYVFEKDRANSSCKSGDAKAYRFWSEAKKVHFYTISEKEKQSIIDNDPSWRYEGYSFCVYRKGTGDQSDYIAAHRFWNKVTGKHFFTGSVQETLDLKKQPEIWKHEGIAFYVANFRGI